jgi:prepilin-type N-terminal cleavage/methylation domain-containing protein
VNVPEADMSSTTNAVASGGRQPPDSCGNQGADAPRSPTHRFANAGLSRRSGFTLIELIVVITIILALAALAAAFMPRVNDSTNLTRAIDQCEQWLLTAKQRAKRDGQITGIQLQQGTGDGASQFSQAIYVQQPDPFTGGTCSTPVPNTNATVTFAGVDFSNGGGPANEFLVQPGDFLEIYGGVHLITAVTANQLTLVAGSTYDQFTIPAGTSNYRILRMPRPLLGEATLQLPANMVIDFSNGSAFGVNGPLSSAPAGNRILFAPNGMVVNPSPAVGQVLLWIWDSTNNPQDVNKAGIVGVQIRTGFIGAYSVAPGSNPYLFVAQGRDSGL